MGPLMDAVAIAIAIVSFALLFLLIEGFDRV